MAIQFEDANNIEKTNSNKSKQCHHVWEKEYYLATNTGDYRCIICGETISKEDLDELNSYKINKENKE